jgi:hypothetical protein
MALQLIQYKQRTWKCKLGTIMRIQMDAIYMKAFSLGKCLQREILAILAETIFDIYISKIS